MKEPVLSRTQRFKFWINDVLNRHIFHNWREFYDSGRVCVVCGKHEDVD